MSLSTSTTSEFLAGGTDLLERRRSGISPQAPQRLPVSDEMRAITWRADGGASVGAAITIDTLSIDAKIAAAYPGLAAAAAGLATPEIRRMATVGGNLMQRSRCWYYRSHWMPCLKKGGDTCPARAGNHRYAVTFDLGPCVAPHPSTLGAACLAYEATVRTSVRNLDIATLFGDGRDGTRDHYLGEHEVLQAIDLPPPTAGERAHYGRAISRAYAEWPLVEVVARAVVQSGRIATLAVALGGVAAVPMRARGLEALCQGAAVDEIDAFAIAAHAADGGAALPQTAYKRVILRGLVADALERVLGTPQAR